ncbi:MAG TPA: circularly permuted type 2 ATP-grasp protein [Acidimicrobiia bacterium]|nr:circularly permuted type 2 ATP-grasp protein [Acidimicrobiia bacterium]
MGDLFEDYAAGPAWDEMFDPNGGLRPGYAALHGALAALGVDDLAERGTLRDRSLRDQGITFSLSGEERPIPLDLLPRVIAAEEWVVLEAGVIQRVRALEAFLADVYGPQQILAEGIVPRALVASSPNFLREAAHLDPPNGVRIQVAGIDILRGPDGRYVVLEDNLRTPSGISYVIENRRIMARVFPELFSSHRIRPVDDYPARLLNALRAAAPMRPGAGGSGEPTIVVLTPGVHNSAYFEHSFLARQMGVELVEGRDLVCRDNTIRMRTTDGERRVDVIYRRTDDDYLDPLQFRPDSLLGCAGIVNAARAGNVAIANAVGNGVADDKAVYPYVPEMIRYYLGELPILDTVPTFRLDHEDEREAALARIGELVWKPVAASGGYGLVIGPQAEESTIDRLREAVLKDPRAFIAQEVCLLSTAPTHCADRLEPRHVDLRPFAVNDGHGVWVAPGGLTRVALPRGSLVVNSSQGGGSKDTWALAGDDDVPDSPSTRQQTWGGARLLPAAAPERGPTGEVIAAQQQQQQQQANGETAC